MIGKAVFPENDTGKHKILFPLDGTDSYENTLQWATRFLSNSDTSIYCLSVIKNGDKIQDPDSIAQVLDTAKTRFENSGFHVAQSEFVMNQKIPEAICEYASNEGIDHIILDTQGRSFARMAFGSISQEVFKRAKQPVLIVNNSHLPELEINEVDRFDMKPGSLRDQVVSVLIPVCDETTAETLIPLMESILNKRAAVVHVLHTVVYDTENIAHINRKLDDAPHILEKNKMALQRAGYWVAEAEYRVGDVVDVISKYAEENAIDQIALLSHPRTYIAKFLFGSVSTRLLKQNRRSVLVFSDYKGNRRNINKPNRRRTPLKNHLSFR